MISNNPPKPRPRLDRATYSARAVVIGAAWLVLILAPGGAAAGDAQAGAKIFASNCARCHGTEAKGDGPDLVKLQAAVTPDDWTERDVNQEISDAFIISMVTKGGKANGKSPIMPAFGDKLSGQQIQDLIAFIRSVAR